MKNLKELTTFNIGGPARVFIEAHTDEEVRNAIVQAHEHSLHMFVLGGGSNILVSDDGFDGLVLAMRVSGITAKVENGHTLITAGAGVPWDDFVAWTVEKNLSGLECLSGIPGTVGGAVVANAGAYGAQCSDTFVSAEVFDTRDAKSVIQVLQKKNCTFAYHDSLFCRESGRYVVLRTTFELIPGNAARLSYQDNRFNLAEFVAKNGREPTLLGVRNAVLDVREQKGALIMNGRLSYKSAGSFFHMPYVSPEKYVKIVEKARSLDATKEERFRPWAWEQTDGSYKLAPGFLLEYTEFQKGYTRGTVGISPKHTLSIINRGGACSRDVTQLARDMQEKVEEIFDVRLEREVEYIGNVENKK